MKNHKLKSVQPSYNEILYGQKTFDVRKNDRGFQVGDNLQFNEYDPVKGYSGNHFHVEVVYILEGGKWGIDKDYCVMGITRITS